MSSKIVLATPAEVADALKTMSAADLLRLEHFAKFRAKGLPWLEWEDLVHEVIKRSLEGERRWPKTIPFINFLRECVRSVAHEEWRRRIEGPITTEADLPGVDPSGVIAQGMDDSPGAEREVAAKQAVEMLERAFSGDRAALAVLAGLAEGRSPAEICAGASMTATDYQSAQKRIRRWALREGNDADSGVH